MMSHIRRGISRLGTHVGYLIASGTGSFVFTNGFRLVARDDEESDTESPANVNGKSQRRMAGIGAAIFLLIFVTSEALAAVVALRR